MSKGYNERLFTNQGLRSKLHFARYFWLKKNVHRWCPHAESILELGCFDGKTLDFLVHPPKRYTGYDANWEGGLDLARKRWARHTDYQFELCEKADDFSPQPAGFDLSICMETLEHLPLREVESYILRMSKATKTYCFVTIPNEVGIIFILKYFFKKIILRRHPEQYSPTDVLNIFLGRVEKVTRNEGGHKGFNARAMIQLLEKYFTVEKIEGIPYKAIPAKLNFTVGIILKKK